MAHAHHEAPTIGHDTRAAFTGLIVGAIVLFAIVRTIVSLTNAKYEHEKPAATATK